MELEKIADLKALPMAGKRLNMRVWESYMAKYHCDTICEIGVRDGDNFMNMIAHNPQLAVAVDCWIRDGVIGRNDLSYSQEKLDQQYSLFRERVANKPFVKICRGYSFDVVKEFPNEYFDLVYIDADHTYEGCKRDVDDWYSKVKKGGVLCGHDYVRRKVRTADGWIRFGVVPAVDEFVKNNKITTFFTAPPSLWGLIK